MIRPFKMISASIAAVLFSTSIYATQVVPIQSANWNVKYPIDKNSTVELVNFLWYEVEGVCTLKASSDTDDSFTLSAEILKNSVIINGQSFEQGASHEMQVKHDEQIKLKAGRGAKIALTNHSEVDLVAHCKTV